MDKLSTLGPKFDHYLEGSKFWLVITENAEERTESIFKYKDHNKRPKTSRTSHWNYKLPTKLHERKNRPMDQIIKDVM